MVQPVPSPAPPRRASRLRRLAVLLTAALVAAACSGDDGAQLDSASVVTGEVVQTIAAAAALDPAGRVTVTAPAGGEIVELLVGDGDAVSAGDPIAVLTSDSIDLQVAQAQAAVEAADAFGAAAAGAGFDLSPVLGAFRAQLDAVIPPLIGALDDQLAVLEATLDGLPDPDAEPELVPVPIPDLGGAVELPDDAELPEGVELPELPELPDEILVPVPQGPTIDASEAIRAIEDARGRLLEAQRGYREAGAQLRSAEAQAQEQAQEAAAGQAAAVDAQRQQAELALDAARSRIDDLTIVAPAAGIVELARADAGGGAGGLDGLDGLGGLAGALGGDAPDIGGLLGGGAGGGTEVAGPVAEGVTVATGQALLTIYDLSGFTARVSVDEIDIVEVAVGQPAVVLVDAFPAAELTGTVTHVALAPVGGAGGGAIFPVTIELTDVPDEVSLRVGLTASAEIEVRRVEAETVVPTSALLRRGGDEVVYVVRDGLAREVPVRVLALGDDTAAVEGRVAVGETVVTLGVETLSDGDPVDLAS